MNHSVLNMLPPLLSLSFLQVDLELDLDHLEEVMGQAMDSLLAKFPPEETAHLAWRRRPQQAQTERAEQGEWGAELPAGGDEAAAGEGGSAGAGERAPPTD